MQKVSLRCQWESCGPSGSGVLPADRVVLFDGLQARPHLNGTQAQVLSWDAPSGRFAVSVSSSGERIKVKPSNLTTIQDLPSLPWVHSECECFLPIDLMLVVARCLSSRNVAVLSAASRAARASLWLRPAARPLWEEILVRGCGALAADVARRARPGAAGPLLCRCARALRQAFQQSLEIVGGSVHLRADGAEVVACPVLAGLQNAGIGAQGAVRRAAGAALEEAAAKLSKPLPPLSVAMVPGGQLAQYVALTVTEPPREVWHGVRPEDRSRRVLGFLGRIHSILFQAVRDSGCRTLAMPTLCTGGIGIPVQLVAIAAVCAVQADFCEHPADPLQVRVACYEEDHIPSFQVIKDTVMEHFFEPERTKRILTSVLDNMGDFEDM